MCNKVNELEIEKVYKKLNFYKMEIWKFQK